MPSLKIAVCVPCYGYPELLFLQSLMEMQKHFYEAKLTNEKGEEFDKEMQLFVVSSSMLTESRQRLVAEALNWGADYMLCCDADHTFLPEALLQLWQRNVQVVGANYSRRDKPTAPTACKIVTNDMGEDHKNLLYTTLEKCHDKVLEEVDHMGMGFVLIRMDVFDILQAHAESQGLESFLPIFLFTPAPDGKGIIGEDVYFFNKLKAAGIKAYCDHEVSWHVGHVMKSIVTNAHAVVQEERWKEKNAKLKDRYIERIKELEGDAYVPINEPQLEGAEHG